MPKKQTKKIERIEDIVSKCKTTFEEINRANRCSFDNMKRQFSSLVRQNREILDLIKKTSHEQTQFLNSLAKTNESVSDTLLNVLLAIRQNEYLQAWYPAQHGFPEMKVSGTHPAKLMKVKDGQSNQISKEIA